MGAPSLKNGYAMFKKRVCQWVKMQVAMELWWNYTDRRKPSYCEKTCPTVTLFTTTLQMEWPGTEPGSPC